jgi:ABC-type sulfate transport system permease subunit
MTQIPVTTMTILMPKRIIIGLAASLSVPRKIFQGEKLTRSCVG